MKKQEYNKEPVFYCKNCLSLNIKELEDIKLDVCQECGNTNIEVSELDYWNKLYVQQYGTVFLLEDLDSIVE